MDDIEGKVWSVDDVASCDFVALSIGRFDVSGTGSAVVVAISLACSLSLRCSIASIEDTWEVVCGSKTVIASACTDNRFNKQTAAKMVRIVGKEGIDIIAAFGALYLRLLSALK